MQTAYTDDRLDPEKATRAAARHLKDLYNEFGDWYLAIAAYNCGPGTVEKAVERTGYADFWALRDRRVLPAETTNYVPIILAMTIMAKNAQAYGIDNVVPEAPLEYDALEMAASTHLALVADFIEVPVSELAALNPALLKNIAPTGYSLRVPKGTGDTLLASLATVPADRRATWRVHKVEGGETLAAIGKRYGAAASSIAAVNKLASADPVAGERLLIPAAAKTETRKVTSTRRTSSSARRTTSSKSRTSYAKSKRPAPKAATTRASAKPSTAPAKKTPPVLARTAAARSRSSASSN
jgi:membrane-bound lytic murein transglycosylase D